MADDVLDDDLVVPASAYEVKPWFDEEPGREVIDEILAWVKDTGRPQEWRGHTHTKPPRGSTPKYLDEFDVPTFGHIADRVAPCPCCSPAKPKYKRGGKIAWFKDEKVIRLIGPRCFLSLSPEGHRLAEAELRARKNREKAIRYLASSLPRLRGLVDAAIAARNVALAVERFRSDLLPALAQQRLDLWQHCNSGELFVFRRETEPTIDRDGSIQYRDIDVRVSYGPLRGYRMLKPEHGSFVLPLDGVMSALRATIAQLDGADVSSWSDHYLRQALKAHNRTLRQLIHSFKELRDHQQFVGAVSVATLKGWGARPDATMSVFVERVGSVYRVGPRPTDWIKSDIPRDLENELIDPASVDPGSDQY